MDSTCMCLLLEQLPVALAVCDIVISAKGGGRKNFYLRGRHPFTIPHVNQEAMLC